MQVSNFSFILHVVQISDKLNGRASALLLFLTTLTFQRPPQI